MLQKPKAHGIRCQLCYQFNIKCVNPPLRIYLIPTLSIDGIDVKKKNTALRAVSEVRTAGQKAH